MMTDGESKYLNSFIDLNNDSLQGFLEDRSFRLLSSYVTVLKAYMQGEVVMMRDALSEIQAQEDGPLKVLILMISELRFQIRTHTIQNNLVESLSNAQVVDPALDGERWFVLGLALDDIREYRRAQKFYLKASRCFLESGLHRKSIKARFNSIVAKSRIYPSLRMFPDYLRLARRCVQICEYSSAGMCYSNISKELVFLGAYSLALKFSNLSLKYLESASIGTLDYDLAVSHKAHVLIRLGRSNEAKELIESLRISSYPEMQEVLLILDGILQNLPVSARPESSAAPASWRDISEKHFRGSYPQRMSDLESKAVYQLTKCPMSIVELAESLYPDQSTDIQLRIDRSKDILKRLRKKFPGLIVIDNKKYFVPEESQRCI